jgi:tellurite resistance protein TerC
VTSHFFVRRGQPWEGRLDIEVSIWFWIAFNIGVLALLALDLGLFHRDAHAPSVKEAAIWSGVWVSLSLLFAAGVFTFAGSTAGVEFLTGYLIEYSLSIDNIFVFVLIFGFFAVPAAYQHRVLFWGILGALIMRGALIGVGAVLLQQFHWVIYFFGALLVFSGIRMATQGERDISLEKNVAVRLFRRFMPVSAGFHGQRFFIRERGVLMATPLLLVLLVVETTDLIFALDSIPAIFAVTDEPFLVYTSNVCAILGLRSLYFLLAGVVDKFHYLKPALSLILVWVGAKMLLSEVYHVPTVLSLFVIGVILASAVVASLRFPKQPEIEIEEPAPEALDLPKVGSREY